MNIKFLFPNIFIDIKSRIYRNWKYVFYSGLLDIYRTGRYRNNTIFCSIRF